ncbi:hypothetical protein N1F89_00230 [Aquibium sp. A9E412]|uniref:hypothetical protein n=1 Tax=Aquibium sp. A9E412 TaxID=2976767 RepID=UPI0025B0A5FD|nr:hypothetical protein [Aquibium sp. A9E412]MDN2564638.1 hypothetical protein [Aquibium sp. A9E412]
MTNATLLETIDSVLRDRADGPRLLSVSQTLAAVRALLPDLALGESDLVAAVVEKAMLAGFSIEFDGEA